jgi:hypothetical protein
MLSPSLIMEFVIAFLVVGFMLSGATTLDVRTHKAYRHCKQSKYYKGS